MIGERIMALDAQLCYRLSGCLWPKVWRFVVMQQEKERAMLNEMVGKLTNVCWDKCITGTPGSKFSSSESTCLSNCAQRYMDMSLIIMRRFQNMNWFRKWTFRINYMARFLIFGLCLWLVFNTSFFEVLKEIEFPGPISFWWM